MLILIAGATLAVVGTGRAWRPPAWILDFGWPGAPAPTGRVASVGGIEYVEISRGCFRMGSHQDCRLGSVVGRSCRAIGLPHGEAPVHEARDCPPHWVKLAWNFWMARTETTREQMRGAAGPAPDRGEPKASVNWLEAVEFAKDLSDRTGLPIRLPTETEWECACRAGTETAWSFGDDPEDLRRYAHLGLDSGRPRPVGSLAPNPWGLHDMHGNLREWCFDAWDRPLSPWELNPPDGFRPRRPEHYRVVRGGGIYYPDCRSTSRGYEYAGTGSNTIGFRTCFVLTCAQGSVLEPYLVKRE